MHLSKLYDLLSFKSRNANRNGEEVAPGHKYKNYSHSTENEHRTAEQFKWRQERVLGSLTTLFSFCAALLAGLTFRETRRQADIAQDTLKEIRTSSAQTDKAVAAGQASAEASREAALQAKRQADIAQQQFMQSKSSSRPYVIAQISRDQLAQDSISGDNQSGASYEYKARLRFTNFGTTPAIIKHIEGAVTLTLPNDRPQFVEEHLTELILPQGQSTKEYIWLRQTSLPEAMNVVVGSGGVYIVGKITYTDTSGQIMSTAFCYVWPLHSHDLRTQLVPTYGPGCFNQSE